MRGQKSRADNSDGWIPRCTPRKSVCPALRQGAQRQVGCFGGCVAGQRSFFLPGSACNIAETVVYLINCTSDASPSSSGLGHRVFIPATRVRLPLKMPVFGRLAQLVRALLSHGRGHEFKSRTAHQPSKIRQGSLPDFFYGWASQRRSSVVKRGTRRRLSRRIETKADKNA